MAEDLGEKTEAPSSRKLSEARERGRLPRSVDLAAAVDLGGALVVLFYFGEGVVTALGSLVRLTLSGEAPGSGPGLAETPELVVWSAWQAVKAAGPLVLLMLAVAYGAQFMQVRWLLTNKPLEPTLERLNPLKGLANLFGRRNLVKTLVAVVKLVLIVVVVAAYVTASLRELAGLPNLGIAGGFAWLTRLVVEMAAWILLLMLVIGAADYAYQRWQHARDLRMTKQEVKDERKSMDGDVEVKGRRLRMARQALLQRMQMEAPKADVVVTNPTHFAVAIKYDADTMRAPRVVAKGADYMAFRLRDIARTAGVPIVEKPALARALYAGCKVGQEVRPELYGAVAEVLAFVYRIAGRAA
jgi:flagellar biosynthetic protein FlhB